MHTDVVIRCGVGFGSIWASSRVILVAINDMLFFRHNIHSDTLFVSASSTPTMSTTPFFAIDAV